MLFKNIASQKIPVYAYNKTTGAAKTGDAANITGLISKDGAGPAATDDVHPTEVGGGWYVFDLTQAETNANLLIWYASSVTADILVEGGSGYTTAGTLPMVASGLAGGLPVLDENLATRAIVWMQGQVLGNIPLYGVSPTVQAGQCQEGTTGLAVVLEHAAGQDDVYIGHTIICRGMFDDGPRVQARRIVAYDDDPTPTVTIDRAWDWAINAEDYYLIQAGLTDTAEILEDTGTTLPATLTILQRSLILNSTTIATLASQTSFTLTAGSTDNDAYNGQLCVVRDGATATQRCVGRVSAYTGATKTITLSADPGVFTMDAGDLVDILPVIYPYQIMPASSRVTASGRVEGEPLEAWQHCDGSWTIAVFDDDDEPIDLTGKNLCFQAFSPDDRSTAVLTLKNYNSDTDITVGGDDGNEATVAYLAADLPDPELYYWLLRDMDTNDKTALGTSKLTVHEAPAAPAVT